LIFFLVFCTSCFNQGDCLITSTNLVKIDLLNPADGTARQTKFLQIVELEDGLSFLNGDSTLTTTFLHLPLSPNRTQATFQFLTSDSVTYHLSLQYTTFTRVVGVECGAYLYYEKLAIDTVNTDFAHTKLIEPKLLTSVKTNLQLSF